MRSDNRLPVFLALNFLFFITYTATTEIYTLSLHTLFRSVISVKTSPAPPMALAPRCTRCQSSGVPSTAQYWHIGDTTTIGDRKSTRLNSSHVAISYAVFCLKKKKYTTRPGRGTNRRPGLS